MDIRKMNAALTHFEDRTGVSDIDYQSDEIHLSGLTADVRLALDAARDEGVQISGLEDCSLIDGGTIRLH